MVTRSTDMVIGKAGEGSDHECTCPPFACHFRPFLILGCLLEGFLGMIDDVKLWSRVLSTKDVQSLYSH